MKKPPMKLTSWGDLLRTTPLAIRADFARRDFRKDVKRADVVLGFDISREQYILFYGRERLQAIVDRNEVGRVKLITVKYDQNTDDLEYLCAALEVLKGHHDYETGRGPIDVERN